jgi:CHASE3 domain sensor protein
MEMWNEIISIIVSNGIFAILFVWLFVYQLRDSSKREEKYQQTIEQLTTRLQILDDVKQDLTDIKGFLKNGDKHEELL